MHCAVILLLPLSMEVMAVSIAVDDKTAYLHGKGIQSNRDWSILSQPSCNFWGEHNKTKWCIFLSNSKWKINGVTVCHYCLFIKSNHCLVTFRWKSFLLCILVGIYQRFVFPFFFIPSLFAQPTHPSHLWTAPQSCWCRRPPSWWWSRTSASSRCRSSQSLSPDHLNNTWRMKIKRLKLAASA